MGLREINVFVSSYCSTCIRGAGKCFLYCTKYKPKIIVIRLRFHSLVEFTSISQVILTLKGWSPIGCLTAARETVESRKLQCRGAPTFTTYKMLYNLFLGDLFLIDGSDQFSEPTKNLNEQVDATFGLSRQTN
jgi:hypothetical protein